MKRATQWGFTAVSALAAATLTSCSAELIRNPQVQRWCGDSPCDWQVEGDIERVGSWHRNDYAVALISDNAALSQENGTIDSSDTDCFSFALVAKIDPGVKVFLELDFLADGETEFSQRLPTSDWERRTFKVTAPDWYSKVRFSIRKQGPGRAILAEISASTATGGCSAPPVELKNRPDTSGCTADEQCASNQCGGGSCGGCDSDAQCSESQLCGVEYLEERAVHRCLERGSSELGAGCAKDSQCASGVCAAGACSECATDAECSSEQQCQPALKAPGGSRFWPRLCGVGGGMRENGEACSVDADCKSRLCIGFEVSCQERLHCGSAFSGCLTCTPEVVLGVCRPAD